jgi:hypothetical protein
MVEKNKEADGRELFKNRLLNLQFLRSKAKGEDDQKTKVRLYHTSHYVRKLL